VDSFRSQFHVYFSTTLNIVYVSAMKFHSSVLLASMVSAAAAFSAVAPASSASATGSPDPIDRSMRGIDNDPATFDPTAGDRPAVTRNNNDQVWVQQVRMARVKVRAQNLRT
jgi:hypothetical protein